MQGYEPRESSVVIVLNATVPSNDLEVELTDSLLDAQTGNALTSPGEKSVVFTGQAVEIEGDDTGGGVDVQDNSTNLTAYQGVTLAINTTNASILTTVEGEDNNYFQKGDTEVNSTVFTFDTSDRELGQYKIFVNNSDDSCNRSYINVRDLQLDISVDNTNVTTEDTIETTVSAVASGRDFGSILVDSGGDNINTSEVSQLDGQDEADVDFDTSSAGGGEALDAGTYTVKVTDNATCVTAESTEITVTEADDESDEFVGNTISDQRGDMIEATVEMTETDTATVSFGSEEDYVIANATVEDDNGDDQVTICLNMYNYQDGSASQIYILEDDSDDEIVTQDQTLSNLGELVDAGDYDFEIQTGDVDASGGGPGVDDFDDVATVTLTERGTERFWTWTAPSGTGVSDLEDVSEAIEDGDLTQTSDIANGDVVVHELRTTGFEGTLDARESEEVSSAFFNAAGDNGFHNLTV